MGPRVPAACQGTVEGEWGQGSSVTQVPTFSSEATGHPTEQDTCFQKKSLIVQNSTKRHRTMVILSHGLLYNR